MSVSKFPNYLDPERLRAEFGQAEDLAPIDQYNSIKAGADAALESACDLDPAALEDEDAAALAEPGITGTRLRSYAFAVLTRREYSKVELIEKLMLRAESRAEVEKLVEEFAAANYQSDERVAEMTIRSQVRRGKGPYRIKQVLKNKHLENTQHQEELKEIDWDEQAYQLKLKKFGPAVAQEMKIKAKQIRFLQYRGFEMDAIMRAIRRKA